MFAINYENCTGCGACVQRCPKQCISWTTKEFDFRYPRIDEASCINCGLCEKVCPIDKELKAPTAQKTYAAVHKDSAVLEKSTSGGAFTALADTIFSRGGVVYGAAMLNGMQVKHIRTEDKISFADLRSSKYLQSDTGTTYQMVEKDLKQGKVVLYSGTPCQIDGLKCFLRKEYENLYTADIVCHGVGSQAYFDKYMEFAKERYGKIKALRFRAKEYAGWSCGGVVVVVGTSNSEKKIPYRDFDNYYYSYFLSGDIYRKCCYSCKYANTKRVGDFSLGDYWGVEALKLPLQTENGCSLLLVNNDRAEKLLETVVDLDKVETTIEQAAHCNKQLNEPSRLPESRKKRIEEYESMSGPQIQKVYLKTHRKTVVKGKLKALMPYKFKLIIRGMRS
ncbi:Coenzyme F420 hydrogenase/dehydrogenase, beta subunit C-terminal domain [Oscillospiraceae bacterium LCP21S3_A1]